jgi:hypothetical protein
MEIYDSIAPRTKDSPYKNSNSTSIKLLNNEGDEMQESYLEVLDTNLIRLW